MLSKIFNYLIERVNLYSIDLTKSQEMNVKKYEFAFKLIEEISDIHVLEKLMSERGEAYTETVKHRLASKNYLCFCYVENSSREAVYTRWLRRDSFEHDRYGRFIKLNDDEGFTMDSYTRLDSRGKGLHTEMNKQMLNFCKTELGILKIYMVIMAGRKYNHLHKTVKDLGYIKINSRIRLKIMRKNKISKV